MDEFANDVCQVMREQIETAVPDAEVEVSPGSGPGHYEIRVVSASFAGQSHVRQQQMVYGAISDLMSGDSAPVHAIDRLRTSVP